MRRLVEKGRRNILARRQLRTAIAPGTMAGTAGTVRAHHLLCAVCARGGCRSPSAPKSKIDKLLKVMWEYPFTPLRITADVDVIKAHFFDVYAGRGKPIPEDFERREADYAARRKDLQVLRLLGIAPDTVLPAYHAYEILFARAPTLEGICRTGSKKSGAWPECRHARKGYYERVAGCRAARLEEQTRRGEDLEGKGIWAMLRPRTRAEMQEAKESSARHILEEADRLYIRPNHLLCILCSAYAEEPLVQDNLVELRVRMEREPDIPVTVVEGCCMVCDSCNVYHPGEHLCYRAHYKNGLRDLMILEKLGLRPGVTLPARRLYRLVYERIRHLQEVCGWGDGRNTAPFWAPCSGGDLDGPDRRYQAARRRGLISGRVQERERRGKL